MVVFEVFPSHSEAVQPDEERRGNTKNSTSQGGDVFGNSLTDTVQCEDNDNGGAEQQEQVNTWGLGEWEDLIHVVREIFNVTILSGLEVFRERNELEHSDSNRCEEQTPDTFIADSLEWMQEEFREELLFDDHLSCIGEIRKHCEDNTNENLSRCVAVISVWVDNEGEETHETESEHIQEHAEVVLSVELSLEEHNGENTSHDDITTVEHVLHG